MAIRRKAVPLEVRSWRIKHERDRPRCFRQDAADHKYLARRDHERARAGPAGGMARAGLRLACLARPTSDRTCNPPRGAIADPRSRSLLRSVAGERGGVEATLGARIPGPCVTGIGPYTACEREAGHARGVPCPRPLYRPEPNRKGPTGSPRERPQDLG